MLSELELFLLSLGTLLFLFLGPIVLTKAINRLKVGKKDDTNSGAKFG